MKYLIVLAVGIIIGIYLNKKLREKFSWFS